MSRWKQRLWVMILSCWVTVALAAQVQETLVSAVQPASPAKKETSTTPAQDYDEALKLFTKGGTMEALQLLKRAADAGHAAAQARYAYILERGHSWEEAVEYYRKSAAQGDMNGQYGLGSVYALGEAVPQDFAEARKWLTLAAEQEQELAVATIAEAYIKGKMGLDEAARQSPEALAWIRRGAGHDQLPALDALAAAYRSGQFGLAADPEQADVIVAKTNKMRGIVTKVPPKKSMLFRLLKGDPDKETVKPK